MDWLSLYKARINCEIQKVSLRNPIGKSISYRSFEKSKNFGVISAMQVRKLVKKGCELFFCSVQDVSKEVGVKIEDVPIVNEFMDVFPSEISGMPPARALEFTIELNPGTSPISKAPYRMAPPEMSELKTQLQELFDKGYIRPSASPWGAPVLFVKKKDGSIRLCIDYRELNNNVPDIRSFLGLAGYYRRFVRDFSKIARPMTNLMNKESKIEWSEKCEEDFQILKERLTSAPVLTLPDGNEGFEYHEGKENVVADALRRKSSHSMNVLVVPEELCRDMQRLSLEMVNPRETKARFSALSLGLSILEEIKESQDGDEYLEKIKEKMGQGKEVDFKIHDYGSLRSKNGNDTIWVIVDRITKSAVFIPIKETWKKKQLAKTDIKHVVRLPGVPTDIISDRNSRFLSKYWQKV
ncbi:uncharacterized protein [Spinacia oleracea]|uniref:Integrase catalytic domain-containing protein n=1 Tax=Spinacia oleracea TaxID=3562 RepID=A0ABM3RHL0_SPIOL|nr:uncharacterized protein LOC130469691 [Spinacia oleracea]